MPLDWIDPSEYSFNSLLLMERFQLDYLVSYVCRNEQVARALGTALKHNPAVKWYIERKCPDVAPRVRELTACSDGLETKEAVREAEVCVLANIEDFVTYTTPEVMAVKCDYIRDWRPELLYELADLNGKRVLDVGSGSGRLAFAASKLASEVYASEPVDTLREFLRHEIISRGITNMRVSDGIIENLPYPDSTFDVVMSGHVIGDDYDKELSEIERVAKPGGWLLSCPGEDGWKRTVDTQLTSRGWEPLYHKSAAGGDIYRYRKQVNK